MLNSSPLYPPANHAHLSRDKDKSNIPICPWAGLAGPSQYVCVGLSLSRSLSLCVCVCESLSFSVCVCVGISLSHSVCVGVSVCVFVSSCADYMHLPVACVRVMCA